MKTLHGRQLSHPVAPHQRRHGATKAVMQATALAALPGFAVAAWFSGSGAVINLLLSLLCMVLLEALVGWRRGQPWVWPGGDDSSLIRAITLALLLPVDAPLWLPVAAAAVAALPAHQAYGGLGRDPFNPALCAILMVYLLLPGAADNAPLVFGSQSVGWLPDAAFLGGGLALCAVRYLDWRIPAAVLGSLALFHWARLGGNTGAAAVLGVWPVGSAVCAAFFFAAEPVTAATTPRGKLLYGMIIGIAMGLYSLYLPPLAAMVLAVLLGNLLAPVIDLHCLPRPLGRPERVRLWL